MGCLRIAKQIEKGLGCGDHVAHAEFAFLTSISEANSHAVEEWPETSQLLDSLKMALEKLPHSILPNLTD